MPRAFLDVDVPLDAATHELVQCDADGECADEDAERHEERLEEKFPIREARPIKIRQRRFLLVS